LRLGFLRLRGRQHGAPEIGYAVSDFECRERWDRRIADLIRLIGQNHIVVLQKCRTVSAVACKCPGAFLLIKLAPQTGCVVAKRNHSGGSISAPADRPEPGPSDGPPDRRVGRRGRTRAARRPPCRASRPTPTRATRRGLARKSYWLAYRPRNGRGRSCLVVARKIA
jgi:hypothetical protein